MWRAGLDEAQAGIKIPGRNINNLRYADDTTLMAESEEELKSLLMKMKVKSEKVGSKFNIQKMKIMAPKHLSFFVQTILNGFQLWEKKYLGSGPWDEFPVVICK